MLSLTITYYAILLDQAVFARRRLLDHLLHGTQHLNATLDTIGNIQLLIESVRRQLQLADRFRGISYVANEEILKDCKNIGLIREVNAAEVNYGEVNDVLKLILVRQKWLKEGKGKVCHNDEEDLQAEARRSGRANGRRCKEEALATEL
ncbi:hypothetical protein Tco_0003365 [Tanacetum coccineum]